MSCCACENAPLGDKVGAARPARFRPFVRPAGWLDGRFVQPAHTRLARQARNKSRPNTAVNQTTSLSLARRRRRRHRRQGERDVALPRQGAAGSNWLVKLGPSRARFIGDNNPEHTAGPLCCRRAHERASERAMPNEWASAAVAIAAPRGVPKSNEWRDIAS